MNLEKNCYTLIGCLITGSLLQSNMNLPWIYFIGITLVLWGGCISIQFIVQRKQKSIDIEIETNRRDVEEKQIERVILSISNLFEEHNNAMSEELNVLRTGMLDKLGDINDNMNIVQECTVNEMKNIQKELHNYSVENGKAISNTCDCIQELQEKLIRQSEIIESLKECNAKSNDKICATITEKIHNCMAAIENVEITLKSCQESYDVSFASLMEDCQKSVIASIEKSCSDMISVGTDIQGAINSMSEKFIDSQLTNMREFNNSTQEMRKDIISIKSALENAANDIHIEQIEIVKELEQIETVTKEFKEYSDKKMNKSLSEIVSCIEQNVETLSNGLISEITKLKGYLEKYSGIQSIERENINKTVTALSDNFMGCISNVQDAIDEIGVGVREIKNCSENSLEKLDDVKGVIFDKGEDVSNKITELSNEMQESTDKQLEIISGESNILSQYDKLLSYINDDVVVKMINDSDNLLKCMKDCYSLLESIRR